MPVRARGPGDHVRSGVVIGPRHRSQPGRALQSRERCHRLLGMLHGNKDVVMAGAGDDIAADACLPQGCMRQGANGTQSSCPTSWGNNRKAMRHAKHRHRNLSAATVPFFAPRVKRRYGKTANAKMRNQAAVNPSAALREAPCAGASFHAHDAKHANNPRPHVTEISVAFGMPPLATKGMTASGKSRNQEAAKRMWRVVGVMVHNV
jgi:hypothetical protein